MSKTWWTCWTDDYFQISVLESTPERAAREGARTFLAEDDDADDWGDAPPVLDVAVRRHDSPDDHPLVYRVTLRCEWRVAACELVAALAPAVRA